MIIEGEFLAITAKVRTNGSSLIVGLNKDECKSAEIVKGSMIQMFIKKIGHNNENIQ